MPYKKTAKFKVCKRTSKKCFSKQSMTKRNAKRQLAEVYSNYRRRRLHGVGGSPQLLGSCPLPLSGSKLDADVSTAVEKFRTALGKYSDLALCHFIKENKSFIFDFDFNKKITNCANVKDAIDNMKRLYNRLEIDKVNVTPLPTDHLTKVSVAKISDDIFDIFHSRRYRITPSNTPLVKTGGRNRRNRIALLTLALSLVGLILLSDPSIGRRMYNIRIFIPVATMLFLLVNSDIDYRQMPRPSPPPAPLPLMLPLPPLLPGIFDRPPPAAGGARRRRIH